MRCIYCSYIRKRNQQVTGNSASVIDGLFWGSRAVLLRQLFAGNLLPSSDPMSRALLTVTRHQYQRFCATADDLNLNLAGPNIYYTTRLPMALLSAVMQDFYHQQYGQSTPSTAGSRASLWAGSTSSRRVPGAPNSPK